MRKCFTFNTCKTYRTSMKCFARLFRDAAKTMSSTETIESLNAELKVAKDRQNLLEESLIAKKICIINVLEGLYLYIPCKLRLMEETQRSAPTENSARSDSCIVTYFFYRASLC